MNMYDLSHDALCVFNCIIVLVSNRIVIDVYGMCTYRAIASVLEGSFSYENEIQTGI